LDGPTGKLITTAGRDSLSDDIEGKNFPWTPRTLAEVLTGNLLQGTTVVDAAKVLEGKIKGFYFSAHWVRDS